METTILWTTFITLVGLQLCLPNGDGEKMAERYPKFWCPNPCLRIFYGLFQLIGVFFVLGFVLYLTFKVHWWYFLIYIGGLILARLIALLMQIPIAAIFSKQIRYSMFGSLVIRRIVGTIMIVAGIILCSVI